MSPAKKATSKKKTTKKKTTKKAAAKTTAAATVKKKATKKTTKKIARKATPKKATKKAVAKKATSKAATKATKTTAKKVTKKTTKKATPKKVVTKATKTTKKAVKKRVAKSVAKRKAAKPVAAPQPPALPTPQLAGNTVDETYDVAVVGGGLAGVCAAIAAARHGCKTVLVQDRPVLGGNASSEIRVPPGGANEGCAWARETGIVEELMTEDRVRNHDVVGEGLMNSQFDMVLYEAVRAERDLTLHLNTSARGVEMADDGHIAALLATQAGSERAYRIAAPLFVDCTGDGTLGAAAGAAFRYGREARSEFDEPLAPPEADDQTQGSSLYFHSIDVGHPVPFAPPQWAPLYPTADSLPSRRCFKHGDIYAGYWWCEIGVPYHTIDDNEAIRDEALRHLMGIWDHIKNHGDFGADNLTLDWISTVPGKRESRRLEGDYILRQADLYQRNAFPDAVAYGGWFIDIHTMGGILTAPEGKPPEARCGDPDVNDDTRVPLYAIPLRSLYSKNVDNLFMAGRNLSATHVALGSTRLILTCAILGQAVGTAAALCLRHHATPRQIANTHIAALQQQLLKDDCFIPNVRNQDPTDLAIGAIATATSSADLALEPVLANADMALDRAQIFPVSATRIDTASLLLRWKGDAALNLEVELARVADVWSFNDPPLGAPLTATATLAAGHEGWVDFAFDATVEPGLYRLRVPAHKGLAWARSAALPGVAAAYKRPHLKIYSTERVVNALRLSPTSAPFGPESVVNGVSRPDRWPNIWISKPIGDFPQALTLDLGAEQTFNTLHLTFDTMLHLEHRAFPPFHRIRECIRDYIVEVERGGEWHTIVEVEGNYQRRRIHRIEPIAAQRIRIQAKATNGEPTARIYEVRVYNEA